MSIYSVDAGFFPTPIDVCFSGKDFYKVLKKYGVPEHSYPQEMPLQIGIAETYAFSKDGEAFVVVIFNVQSFASDVSSMAGIVAHETIHVVERIFEHIGEDEIVGEETRAYLVQHLVEQIYQACVMEIHKYAKRKSNRKTLDQVGEGKEGVVPEVGQPQHDGGARSDSLVQRSDQVGRAKRPARKAISTTDIFSWTAGNNRNKGPRLGKRGRG